MRLATIGLAGVLVWAAGSVPAFAQPGTHSLPGNSPRRGTTQTSPGFRPTDDVAQRAADLPSATYWREATFPIPFALEGQSGRQLEVLLFVSVDRGASWQLFDRKGASERQFLFKSERDGEYWFASKTVDAQSGVRPALPERPQLRVIVDTSKPKLELNADVQAAGEVQASWQISDPTVVPQSFKLEYQPLDGGAWEQVAVEKPDGRSPAARFQGHASWWPKTDARTIMLRAEVRDAADNRTVVTRRVFLTRAGSQRPPADGVADGGSPTDTAVRRGGASDGSTRWPANGPADGPAEKRDAYDGGYTSARDTFEDADTRGRGAEQATSLSYGSREGADSSAIPGDVEELPEPSNHTTGPYSRNRDEMQTVPDAETLPAPAGVPEDLETSRRPRRDERPPYRAVSGQAPPPLENQGRREPDGRHGSRDSRTARQDRIAPPDDTGSDPQNVELPAGETPHLTNTGRFTLDYDIDSVGPAGVDRVELWATEDGGKTWTKWGTDPDRRSPFDVEIDREGTYGFRIVIVSASGLASPAPRAGEPADIWIGLDTTKPSVRFTTVKYGEGPQTGQLVIRWEASDAQLQSRPIGLLFAENPDGPWTTIASGLPNSGEYGWPADPNLRGQVYLRIEAHDEAENTGLDQLEDPVDLDGLSPKGRIRGFRPGDRSSRVGPVSPRRR